MQKKNLPLALQLIYELGLTVADLQAYEASLSTPAELPLEVVFENDTCSSSVLHFKKCISQGIKPVAIKLGQDAFMFPYCQKMQIELCKQYCTGISIWGAKAKLPTEQQMRNLFKNFGRFNRTLEMLDYPPIKDEEYATHSDKNGYNASGQYVQTFVYKGNVGQITSNPDMEKIMVLPVLDIPMARVDMLDTRNSREVQAAEYERSFN